MYFTLHAGKRWCDFIVVIKVDNNVLGFKLRGELKSSNSSLIFGMTMLTNETFVTDVVHCVQQGRKVCHQVLDVNKMLFIVSININIISQLLNHGSTDIVKWILNEYI
jgi:hypothetical protein